MRLNRYVALFITLFVDLLLLGLGSLLIAYTSNGGTLFFVIECSIIFAVHKALYGALTGAKDDVPINGTGADTTPDLYAIFSDAWTTHNTQTLSKYVADFVLWKNEEKEERVSREQFLTWVGTYYKSFAILGKEVPVEAKVVVYRGMKVINTVVDEIHEYEMTLGIDNNLIAELSFRQSFFSSDREYEATLAEGIDAARKIINKYAESHLDADLFQWIVDKPVNDGHTGITGFRLPHLLFSYNGIKYGICVEIYDESGQAAPVCMWNKLDFDAFIQQSEKENFMVCFMQINKQTNTLWNDNVMLQDAEGNTVELNPHKP